MEFQVTRKGNTVCVDKVLEPEKEVIIPASFDGLPVTELGPYMLAGAMTKEVTLPPFVSRIGAYAFYNCPKLGVIHCYGRAADLGAGVFAGDRGISMLDLIEFPEEPSCLKEMLSEIHQTLRVRVRELRGVPDPGETYDDPDVDTHREARLLFPEYYEESVENTPARQLVYEMHGCGQRYRYSFVNRELNYAEYDGLFSYAKTLADEETAAELAIGRIRFPRSLSATARETYESYLCEHCLTAALLFIRADSGDGAQAVNTEPEMLPWFLETIARPDEEQIRKITEMARSLKDTQMVSYLMDYSHKKREREEKPGGKRSRARRFELT